MNFTIVLIFILFISNCVLYLFYHFWTRIFCLISIFYVLRFANMLFARNIELVFWNVHFNYLLVLRITKRVLLQFRLFDIQSINILTKFVKSFALKSIFLFSTISLVCSFYASRDVCYCNFNFFVYNRLTFKLNLLNRLYSKSFFHFQQFHLFFSFSKILFVRSFYFCKTRAFIICSYSSYFKLLYLFYYLDFFI